jgi:KaiC/GvpD/RAD55 family RecA-like ATPase
MREFYELESELAQQPTTETNSPSQQQQATMSRPVVFKSEGERVSLSAEQKKFLTCQTSFQFLNDHYGLRPGEIHLLLSTAGAGKSSLVRGILGDLIANRVDTLFYSTEETYDQFRMAVADSGFMPDFLPFVRFLHEDTMDESCDGDFDFFKVMFKHVLSEKVHTGKPKVLIFDNLTMCEFFDDIRTNLKFCKYLLRTIRQMGIAALLVVHTKKDVRQTSYDFDTQDVKGSAIIANRAENMYGLRVFRTVDEMTGRPQVRSFVKSLKSRFHDTQGNYYELSYSRPLRRFIADKLVEEGVFADAHAKFAKARSNKK